MGRLGELLLAVPMRFAGCLHFRYGPGVAKIVPPWGYISGVILLAAGVCVVIEPRGTVPPASEKETPAHSLERNRSQG